MKKFYSRFIGKKLLIVILCFICVGRLWATDVSGDINGNATWYKDSSPYVITGNVTVVSGTLTIEPGVEVQFPESASHTSQLIIFGTLKAIGKSDDSIKFTGGSISYYYDDKWRGPITIDGQNSVLRYVKIRQLGYHNLSNDVIAAIKILSPNCLIEHCSIQNIHGTAILEQNGGSILRDNVITNNTNNSFNLDVVLNPDFVRNLIDNNKTSSQKLRIGLYHGDMSTNDTLPLDKAEAYWLLDNVSVPIGKILKIDAGVKMIFPEKADHTSQLIVAGKLIAVGDDTNYIQFLGGSIGYYYDDRWRGPITITPTSNSSLLQYVTINGLGYHDYSDYRAAIIIQSSSCVVKNCNLINTQGTGIKLDNARPIIANNNFNNSKSDDPKEFLDIILNPDYLAKVTGNNKLKIGLVPGKMTVDDTLSDVKAIYYKLLDSLVVPQGKTLTIEPNVEIDFPESASHSLQMIVKGTLKAVGTPTNYITFLGGTISYYYDDKWRGPITIETTSENSALQYVNVNGLGYYKYSTTTPVIKIRSSSTTIANCNIFNSKGVALSLESNIAATLVRNCFFSNYAGVSSSIGSSKFGECNFVSNTAFGLKNTSLTDTLDASNCWWNSLSGPTEVNTNPSGGGDIVSDNIIYNSWSLDQFDCSEPSPILPLTLLNFQTTLSNNTVNCSWQTATETNTSYFLIQRSTDGANFTSLGKVYAAGNSNSNKSYSFIDKSPNNGINYYHLQMADKDGRYTYSKTLPINISIKQPFAIYPNPVKEILYVQVQRTVAEKVSLQIIDMQGKMVAQQSQQLTAGVTTLSVNTTALVKGSYFIVIKGKTTEKKLFVKE